MLHVFTRSKLEAAFSEVGPGAHLIRAGARTLMKAMKGSDEIHLPVPRVHGNGFIQVDLKPDGSKRMHVWGHPDIPSQNVNTGVHDHTYGVDSVVIIGSIVDLTWQLSPMPSALQFDLHEAIPREGQDTRLENTNHRVSLVATEARLVGEGSARGCRYQIESGQFHSTVTNGPAVSIMRKTPPGQIALPRPRIAVPVGQTPDNSFDRNKVNWLAMYGIISAVYPSWLEQMDGSD